VPFSTTYAYRLCFRNGALIAKDIVQTGSVQPELPATESQPNPGQPTEDQPTENQPTQDQPTTEGTP
jgi:hypothetical protein